MHYYAVPVYETFVLVGLYAAYVNIPEERRSHLLRGGNLKSRKVQVRLAVRVSQ